MVYKHTQVGYLIIAVLIAITLLYGGILGVTLKEADSILPAFFIMFLVMFIIASFATLKVVIDEDYLRIKFGYGIFQKSFMLKKIISVKKVKNHWYYGWGIRLWLWPYMWIFNISGFDAVEITMRNNKIYRIGSDESNKLEQAILQSIAH